MHVCALSVALLGLVALIDTSPCPEVIKSFISYGSYGRDKTLPAIYKTLTSCPGVRALDLKIFQGGCVHSLDDPWSFKFSRRDRFPSLKSLSLEGYHFDDTEATLWQKLGLGDGIWYSTWEYLADMTGVNALRPYEQPIESPSASNLDQWRLAMDWTQLQTLEIADTNPRFLRKMTGQMPVLQSLKLGIGWTEGWCDIANQTSRFLAASPPLSSLSLHGYAGLMNWTEILPRHGSALKSLQVHEWESSDPASPRPVLSIPQLQRINNDCPLLEGLSVGINRNGNWPYEVLDTLATFKNLRKLHLWFELGIDQHQGRDHYHTPRDYTRLGEDSYRQPRVNPASASTLFSRLRAQKTGVELQELIMYVGDWGRSYGGGLRMPVWGEGLGEKHTCSVLGSDGQRRPEGEAWCDRQYDSADDWYGLEQGIVST